MHHRSCRPLATTLTVVLAATTAAAFPAFGQEALRPSLPELAGGTVTLPYTELRALLLAAQAPRPEPVSPPPVPPVPFRVGAARFALEVTPDGRSVHGRATFEVQTFAPGWTLVPLLPAAEARLVGVEPAGALVAVRDDALTLLVEKPDRQTVTLLFTAPLADGKLALHPAPALVNELKVVNVPAGILAEVAGATRDEATGAFALAAGQGIALALVREEDRRPAAPPTPSVWRVVGAETLVRYDDGRLVYRTRLRAADDAGPGLKLELRLPDDADVIGVRGPDLLRWQATRTGDGRRLEIFWQTADLPRREVFVDYERPQPAPDSDWSLVAPRAVTSDGNPAPSAPTPSAFALLAPDDVEFAATSEAAALPAGETRELPRWLAAEVGGRRFVLLPSSSSAKAGLPATVRGRRPVVAAPVPSDWRIEVEPLVRYDDGRLFYQTRLRAAADAGSGLSLELALPAAANVLRVAGPDLDRWRTEKSADGRRRLAVSWKTPDLLRRELFVDYEMPQATPDGDWSLVTPQSVPRSDGTAPAPENAVHYTLALPDGVEFADATPGDPRSLPPWLTAALGNSPFVTAQATTNGGVTTRVRRLPRVPTAPATVEEANYKTRLVADGATLTEARLTVRHDGPLPLVLTLPAGTALLACSVDEHETLPVDRGQGRVEFTLPAGTGDGKTLSRVNFSATGRTAAPLAPVAGQTALALPQTDLFIQTLRWDLQIPDAYELTALDGNVELTPAKDAADVAIHLRKELLKGERPAAELFYQKRAVTP